jgi:hypothetical protein
MSSAIPRNVKILLWDTNESDISLKKHSQYIIERVLEYGDIDEILWLKGIYDIEQIQKVLCESKRISPETGNFFSLLYNIPRESMRCIQKPFMNRQERF